jgi:putative beta-lysine N-acetyltransferase
MRDKIEKTTSGSVIQHGDSNDRVYLIKTATDDYPSIIDKINHLAGENGYGKIFAKIPVWMLPGFMADGFIIEAHVPGMNKGTEAVFFVSKFLNSDRLLDIETDKLRELSQTLKTRYKVVREEISTDYKVKELRRADAERIASVFSKVFATYPFPINDPGYIAETFSHGTRYFGIENGAGKLIAVSSAEVDMESKNAEMTDFAVSKDYRGKKLSVILLMEMERYMKKAGVKTLFTIARLKSLPMNKTFLRLGYRYSGTLIKNTNIAGNIESMNVLYKSTDNLLS